MGRRAPKIKRHAQSQGNAAGERLPPKSSESEGIKSRNDNAPRRETSCAHENVTNRSVTMFDNIFPRWLPWILFPLTLALRIFYVLEPTNWWVLHPDEIFQTMEVAHSDVFGYGFRPYEYLPPPSHDDMNSTTISAAHAQEIRFGMFSLRSFLLPKCISSVMILANMTGINTSPYLIIKIFHVTVTSLLPVVVFQFSRTLHRSRDIGCLSAILVSSSLSLNIFGTHTLINSFLAPFFFICLIPLVSALTTLELRFTTESNQSEHSSFRVPSNTQTEANAANGQNIAISGINDVNEQLLDNQGGCPNDKHSDGIYTRSGQSTQESNKSNITVSSHDENANVICVKENISNENANNKYGYRNTDVVLNFKYRHKCIENNENIEESRNSRFHVHLMSYDLLAGFGLALCIFTRIDLIFIPFLLLAGFCLQIFKNITEIVKSLHFYFLGIVVGTVIGGYCDYITYGRWFFSPYQWYNFNVRNSFAGRIFGINNWYFYLLKLYQNEPLVTMSFTILFIDILVITHRLFTPSNKDSQPANKQSLAVFIFLLLAFSLNSHKELRLLHNAILFMYIAVSGAIFSMLKRFASNQNRSRYSIYIVYIFIGLFTSSHCFYFVNMRFGDRANWTYGQNIDSHETNICLDFIRQQKDVTGVFMDRSVHISGAYSILHNDVPIFAFNIFEYMEYRKTPHSDSVASLDLSFSTKNGFTVFTNISDFISVYNSQYLFRKIRQSPEYNYLILKASSDFIDTGYDEVYRVRNSKVLTRTFKEQREKNLAKTTNNMNIFWNATILEYEGYWLKHYGLYTKAEQRVLTSNRIDPRRIGPFRILLSMYSKLKQTDDYRSVLKACLQIYNKRQCQKPYTPIILHSGYYSNI